MSEDFYVANINIYSFFIFSIIAVFRNVEISSDEGLNQ